MTHNPTNSPDHHSVAKKKRGAQPGNRNAFKHGYYANNHSDTSFLDLEDEILRLRLFLRLAGKRGHQVESLPEILTILRTLTFASRTIARLIKINAATQPNTSHTLVSFIDEAIDEVMNEAIASICAEKAENNPCPHS
jgi:hypothetical protein